MLTHALGALKNYLNTYLKTQAGIGSSSEDRVIFFEDQGAETSLQRECRE
jgi:hypothetical protein